MRRIRHLVCKFFSPIDDQDTSVRAAPALPVRQVFRRFWPYARPYRNWLAVMLAVVAVRPALDAATIWLYKLLVDDVLVPRDFAAFGSIAVAYLTLTLAGGLVSFGDDYLSAWVGERFLLTVRTNVFQHLQRLSLDFFESRPLGDLVARLTSDVAAIESLVLAGVASALSYALRIVFFASALFYLQWELALVSLLVAPLFWLAARYFSERIKLAAREQRRRSGSLTAVVEEALANITLVQAYNRQGAAVERFEREGLGSLRAQLAATRLRALFTPLVDLIELGGILVVVAVGTWGLVEGRLSLGGLLVFMAYLAQLYSPIRGLSRLANTVHAAAASAERIAELLGEEPSVVERDGAQVLQRAQGAIAFEDIAFRYPGAARAALHGVSFSVGPGETVALVGASGAGKSTLAKLLLRFYDPEAGRIRLDGHDLRNLDLASLRDNVAVVLQETLVFDGTIADNIAYGRPGATHAQIERAACAADAHTFIQALPDGYDTRVGQKGRRLSGGERQRLALARAIVRDAPLLLLDEPTTGLDAASGERVLEPLRCCMAGRTTLIVSHNLALTRSATRIVVLDDGRIAEEGTHTELLRRDGLYAHLYRLHQPDDPAHATAEAEPAPVALGA